MVVGDISTGTDVLVIGGGPAGYVAAIRAGQLDLDVTLVERERLGGVCLNHGCIPSKAMITATAIAHRARTAEAMGVHADPVVDLAAMVEWKDGVVDRLTGGVERLCEANGVSIVEGTAEFVDRTTARVRPDEAGRGSETVTFEHAVLATGSRPIELPGFAFEDDPILSSREALAIERAPDSLAIVGAGYIGMELAGVFAKIGTDVTVIEMLDDVLPGYASDLARPVRRRAESLGIEFHFGRVAASWHEHDGDGDGIVLVTEPASDPDDGDGDGEGNGNGNQEVNSTVDTGSDAGEVDGDGELEFEVERALIAVGRRPVTDTVSLGSIDLPVSDDGFIETDEQGRTAVENVFAVGDVAGEPMLAHKGMLEGRVAAEAIAGEPSALDRRAIPAAVFTEPEIGTVGLTREEAAEAGFEPVTGRFPFMASGRAMTADATEGFVRLVADGEEGFVLGGQVVGHEASELIAEIGLAIELGATLEDVAATVHTHPTMSEAVMEAAEAALGRAIHTVNR